MKMNHKGQEGKKTGTAARKAISSKSKAGSSNKQIGNKVNRSASTIAKIKSGAIKNPPASLSAAIRKSKPAKSKPAKSKRK